MPMFCIPLKDDILLTELNINQSFVCLDDIIALGVLDDFLTNVLKYLVRDVIRVVFETTGKWYTMQENMVHHMRKKDLLVTHHVGGRKWWLMPSDLCRDEWCPAILGFSCHLGFWLVFIL